MPGVTNGILTENFWLLILAVVLLVMAIPCVVGLVVRKRKPDYENMFTLIFAPSGVVTGLKMTTLASQMPALLQNRPEAVYVDVAAMALSGVFLAFVAIASGVALITKAWSA